MHGGALATWTKPWPLVAHGRERELSFAKKKGKGLLLEKKRQRKPLLKKKKKGASIVRTFGRGPLSFFC